MSVDAEKSAAGSGIQVPNPRPRRRWSAAKKRRIVAETYEPGASVSVVARRHDVNANQVFTWRRQFREGAGGGFLPVVAAPAGAPERLTPSGDTGAPGAPETGPASTACWNVCSATPDGASRPFSGPARPGCSRWLRAPGSPGCRSTSSTGWPAPGSSPCRFRSDDTANRDRVVC